MLSSCVMSAVCLLVSALLPVAVHAPACGVPVRVRPFGHRLLHTLNEAYARSPTVRELVDELERSDVIVHLIVHSSRGGPAGTLRFVTAAGGFRFVRITVDDSLPPPALAALVAHELQHAVEVGRAWWVRDPASFAALYRLVGHASGGRRNQYDTVAAERVGARVHAEMRWRATRRSAHALGFE